MALCASSSDLKEEGSFSETVDVESDLSVKSPTSCIELSTDEDDCSNQDGVILCDGDLPDMNEEQSFTFREKDVGQKLVLEQLQSLLYKCQLYGKFFERRYAQHNQKLLQAEHRHIKRSESLLRKRAQVVAVSEAPVVGDISLSANDNPTVSGMDSVSMSGINNHPISVFDDMSKSVNEDPPVSAMESVSMTVLEHLSASQTDSNSQQTVESGYQSVASTGFGRSGTEGHVSINCEISSVSTTCDEHISMCRNSQNQDDRGFVAGKQVKPLNDGVRGKKATAAGRTLPSSASKPSDQPSLLSGGVLRPYQLHGFRWLRIPVDGRMYYFERLQSKFISAQYLSRPLFREKLLMYECGFSGILADEMGLGKTIQCLTLICYLVNRRLCGPFLICAPLSAIPTWVNELRQFAPKLPFLVYHGDQRERIEKRSKLYSQPVPAFRRLKACPVVITTYDLVILDRQFLSNVQWHLIIVDEGHRIRNLHCRLFRELSVYKTPVKILVTGTPMQNNLSDLCSMLIFLVPELSVDIISLQDTLKTWAGAKLPENGSLEHLIEEKEFENVLALLHQILTPFLLRRLKSDVGLKIPPKKEVVIRASMTAMQWDMYKSMHDRALLVHNRAVKEVLLESDNSVNAVDETEINAEEGGGTCQKTDINDEEEGGTRQKTDINDEEAEETRRKRTLRSSSSSMPVCQMKKSKVSNEEFAKQSDISVEGHGRDEVKLSCIGDLSNGEDHLDIRTVDGESPIETQLRNVVMELRRICNHPALINDDCNIEMNESLVSSCGKLSVLDKLLTELQRGSHKVLIFCQFIEMLNVLEIYCEMRQFSFCRFDGATSIDERAYAIKKFNDDRNVFLFLLSTRSGGMSINLTAADTVVIYESDWNPQWDIQAQDRCHRIGQTRPVVVYRLVTPNTIDEKIFKCARAKTRLERLVIHKDKFKSGVDDGITLSCGELVALLRDSTVSESDFRTLDTDDVEHLLDRTDLFTKWSTSHANSS